MAANPTPPAPPAPPPTELVLLAMLRGHDPEKAARLAGVRPEQVDDLIAEARRQLTVAADFNRDEQLGKAISRLNDCYSLAAAAKDVRTCVQVQKELNRLLDLYRPTVRHVDAVGQAGAELAAVRAHLGPLELGPQNATAAELARLAVAEIVSLRSAR